MNIQQIPARTAEGKEFRSLFVAEKGCSLVVADYSAIELVIIGILSGDKSLLEALKNFEDLHCYTMSRFLNCSYLDLLSVKDGSGSEVQYGNIIKARSKFDERFNLPELRQEKLQDKWVKTLRDYTKTLTYGIAYGLSSFGLSRKFHCDANVAQQFIDSFFSVYPTIKGWLDKQSDKGIKLGYSVTPTGRRRNYFPARKPTQQDVEARIEARMKSEDRVVESVSDEEYEQILQEEWAAATKEYRAKVGRIRRQAANHPIQGVCSDCVKYAMVLFEEQWVSKFNLDWKKYGILLSLHDELILEFPKKYAEKAAELLKECMEKAPAEILQIEQGTLIKITPFIADHWRKS